MRLISGEAHYVRVIPLHAKTFYEDGKQQEVHGRRYSANDEISNYATMICGGSYGLIFLIVAWRELHGEVLQD